MHVDVDAHVGLYIHRGSHQMFNTDDHVIKCYNKRINVKINKNKIKTLRRDSIYNIENTDLEIGVSVDCLHLLIIF